MHTASKQLAIMWLVDESELSSRRNWQEIKVSRDSFHYWHRDYEAHGLDDP